MYENKPMKNLPIFLSYFLFAFVSFSQSDCLNLDFEDGTIEEWETTGNVIVVNQSQTDPYGNFNLSSSGFYSVKLGNKNSPEQSTIKRTMQITSDTKYFIYSYAIVLLGYPHSEEEAANVQLKVKDAQGNEIPCASYTAIAQSSVGEGFLESSAIHEENLGSECCYPIFYKPWETKAINLEPYIGQFLTFELSNNWCVYSVDWGYSYVDAFCTTNLVNCFSDCVNQNYYIAAMNGFQNYFWSGPGIVSGQGTSMIEVNVPGVYTVDIPNPQNNCDPVHLEIETALNELPDYPELTVSASNSCLQDTAQIEGNIESNSPIVNMEWSINGEVSDSTSMVFDYPVGDETSYSVMLIAENSLGCKDSIIKEFQVHPFPALDLGDDHQICPGESIELKNELKPNSNLLWNDSIDQSILNVSQEGLYTAILTEEGCSSYDSVVVSQNNMFLGEIPNIFTPNNDGVNDVFEFEVKNIPLLECSIYNRWGNLMFKAINHSPEWDGKFNGEAVSNGVYLYELNFECLDKTMHLNGFIHVEN